MWFCSIILGNCLQILQIVEATTLDSLSTVIFWVKVSVCQPILLFSIFLCLSNPQSLLFFFNPFFFYLSFFFCFVFPSFLRRMRPPQIFPRTSFQQRHWEVRWELNEKKKKKAKLREEHFRWYFCCEIVSNSKGSCRMWK